MNNQQQLKLKVRKMSDKVMNIPRQIRSNANIKLIDTTLNNLEQPIYPKDIISSNLNRQRVYFGDAKMKLSKSLDRLSRKLKTTEGFGRTHGGPAVNPSASRGVGGGVRTRKEGFAPAGGQSRGVPPGGAYVTGGASRPTGPYPTPTTAVPPPAIKFGQGGSGTYKGPYPTPKPTAVPPPVIKFGQGGRGTYKGPYPSYGGYGRGPYPEYRNRTVVRNYYGNGWGGYYDGWSRGWWPWSYPTIPVEVPVEVPVAETATKTPMENQMMFIMVVLAIMLFLYLILRRK